MPSSALPTFNSNAIETNLHMIPDLASCFLYLNDDMILGRAQPDLQHYWNEDLGVQKVHFGGWMAPLEEKQDESWHRAIAHSNYRLDKLYGKSSRAYPLHGCYFFHKKIFSYMRKRLASSFARTLHSRFRSSKDNVMSFLYPHIAVNDFGAQIADFQFYYSAIRPNLVENLPFLRYLVRRKPLCACINDELGNEIVDFSQPVAQLIQVFEMLYPVKAPWEKSGLKVEPFDPAVYSGLTILEICLRSVVAGPAVFCLIMFIISGMARVIKSMKPAFAFARLQRWFEAKK
jgi:hypothetical protein